MIPLLQAWWIGEGVHCEKLNHWGCDNPTYQQHPSAPKNIHIEDCEGWWLSCCRAWLSGRVLVAQARGVLGLTPSDCRPFHLPLIQPHNIYVYFQRKARCSEQEARIKGLTLLQIFKQSCNASECTKCISFSLESSSSSQFQTSAVSFKNYNTAIGNV